MRTIEIPDPIFMLECESRYLPSGDYEFTVGIVVGGVTVMERHYTDDFDQYDTATYADGEEDAKERTLRAFGQSLHDVLRAAL